MITSFDSLDRVLSGKMVYTTHTQFSSSQWRRTNVTVYIYSSSIHVHHWLCLTAKIFFFLPFFFFFHFGNCAGFEHTDRLTLANQFPSWSLLLCHTVMADVRESILSRVRLFLWSWYIKHYIIELKVSVLGLYINYQNFIIDYKWHN